MALAFATTVKKRAPDAIGGWPKAARDAALAAFDRGCLDAGEGIRHLYSRCAPMPNGDGFCLMAQSCSFYDGKTEHLQRYHSPSADRLKKMSDELAGKFNEEDKQP